jgi:hypothetical protein
MLFDHDGSRGFAVKAVEQHGLVSTELELGLQVGAALIAVIIRITHTTDLYDNIRRPCHSCVESKHFSSLKESHYYHDYRDDEQYMDYTAPNSAE